MKSLDALLAGSSRFSADRDSCGSRAAVVANTFRIRRREGVFQVEDIVSARSLLYQSALFYSSAREELHAVCSWIIARESKQ